MTENWEKENIFRVKATRRENGWCELVMNLIFTLVLYVYAQKMANSLVDNKFCVITSLIIFR